MTRQTKQPSAELQNFEFEADAALRNRAPLQALQDGTFASGGAERGPAMVEATMTVRKIVLGVVGSLAALMLFGWGLTLTGYESPTDPPPAHVISGTFTLVDDATAKNNCVGPSDGNWRDVRPGAEVAVHDGGTQLGSGSLGDGKAVTWGRFGSLACAYDFTVGVPTAERYTIDYPGGLSTDYAFEDLESFNWQVGADCCRVVPAN